MNLRARVYSPESQCGNLGEFFWNEHLTYIHMKAEINILKNAVGMNHSDTDSCSVRQRLSGTVVKFG